MAEAKKRLGQHWLTDAASLDEVVEAAQLTATDTLLEIGPGLGDLTKRLLAVTSQVTAVELDDDLIGQLQQQFGPAGLQLVHQNILDFDLSSMPAGYKVVANIPYYITGQVVRRLTSSPNPPSLIVLLVQKEVAQRLAAGPGQTSILTISAQLFGQVDALAVIPAACFVPPPKVDSQIVRLTKHTQPITQVPAEDLLRLVKAGFSERRKKLRSSLSGGLQRDKAEIDQVLAAAQIDPAARAQDLSISDWEKLYNSLYNS